MVADTLRYKRTFNIFITAIGLGCWFYGVSNILENIIGTDVQTGLIYIIFGIIILYNDDFDINELSVHNIGKNDNPIKNLLVLKQ